jgi:hypothetical protein
MLSLHAFRLLFLRSRVWKGHKWSILVLGWSFISSAVAIGPLAIQKKAVGPYFGPSGYWYGTYSYCLFRCFANAFKGAGLHSTTLPLKYVWNTCW